jgi:UDP-glucose 4-epimerase
MQVFISGAAGFLGSYLAEAYVGQGAHVIGVDNLIGGDLSNLPEGIQFEEADCCDVATMKRLMAGSDLVYHCAAIATEGLSVFSPALIAQHVYQNTAAMLAAASMAAVFW